MSQGIVCGLGSEKRNVLGGRDQDILAGLGANEWGICRFDAGEIMSFSQVCAYGTACVIEKIEERR